MLNTALVVLLLQLTVGVSSLACPNGICKSSPAEPVGIYVDQSVNVNVNISGNGNGNGNSSPVSHTAVTAADILAIQFRHDKFSRIHFCKWSS
jgi:hypothetical protein